VYAVQVCLTGSDDENEYKGMMNIGTRPTVDGINRVIEVNLFDFSGDIYDKTLRVYLKKRLRAEEKFNGLEALKAQLGKDRTDAIAALG
jgi:FAD synthase